MFNTVMPAPMYSPVLASPAARSAPLEHEEHQHPDAEQEHRPQKRQRLGADLPAWR